MTDEIKSLKEASKIVPSSNYRENIDDEYNSAIWAFDLIQKQDNEAWGDFMLLNSETARKTKLNLKKQLNHTSDSQLASMMSSAIADPSTWPDTPPHDYINETSLDRIANHLSSIDDHLANIELLLRKRK